MVSTCVLAQADTIVLSTVNIDLGAEELDDHGDFWDSVFRSMGEEKLESARPQQRVVRISIWGGLGGTTIVRFEGDSLTWKYREGWTETRCDWSFRVRLTTAELDTLERCLDTLAIASNHEQIGDGPYIDGATFDFEIADREGYHTVFSFHPERYPRTAPLMRFIDNLWERNTHTVSFVLVDSTSGNNISMAKITLQGPGWLHRSQPGFWGITRFYAPTGDYTLHIDSVRGFLPMVVPLHLTDDTNLDTLRLRHRRITLRTAIMPDDENLLYDKPLLYIEGVDTAIPGIVCDSGTLDGWNPWGPTRYEFRDVPAGNSCFFVNNCLYGGGWYHSPRYYLGDSLMHDTVLLHMDFGREAFATAAKKDSALIARAARLRQYLADSDSLLELGRLFYSDFTLHWMPTWQTFDHAGDSAFLYLESCYRHDPKRYGYLYYPLYQLAHHGFVSKHELKPPIATQKTYIPLPEGLEDEYRWSYDDCLSMIEKRVSLSRYFAEVYAPLGEPSLAVPQREQPAVRFSEHSVWSKTPGTIRVDGGKIYYQNKRGKRRSRKFTANEQDTLMRLLKAVDAEGYGTDVKCYISVIDGPLYFLEYSLNGQFHYIRTHNPDELPTIKALSEWLEKKVNRKD